ncbi:MAG TPA: hypothetical protein VM095_14495 [Pyrinomonadaceae bacterium]|nr:hypothetical protein [Pyrinomonadaceae bacterium]
MASALPVFVAFVRLARAGVALLFGGVCLVAAGVGVAAGLIVPPLP